MKLATLSLLLCACAGGARHAPLAMAPADRAAAGYAGEAEDDAGGGDDGDDGAPAPLARAGVAAGEWDDNANYREFQRLLASHAAVGFHALDVRDRQFLVVRDSAGKGVPGCRLQIVDRQGGRADLVTLSSGRALLFPHAERLTGTEIDVTAHCRGADVQRTLTLAAGEGVHAIDLPSPRALAGRPVIDVAFILDTTGSMGEEIAAVKDTIRQVAVGLRGLNVEVRLGLVEYKDRNDVFVTRNYPFTRDLAAFVRSIERIDANGGGDRPEHVNAGLAAGVHQLDWSADSVARVAFLIGDAPPHLDYEQDTSYIVSARVAAARGIQLYTVAASGMDLLGQMVFRQIAQYTAGTNLFVLRGGAGPQSVGGGDPASSCGGTQSEFTSGNLDALLIARIRGAVAALDGDPMRIAGLGEDEKSKPCAARVATY